MMGRAERNRLLNAVSTLRHMYDLDCGYRTDLLAMSAITETLDWIDTAGEDAVSQIVTAEHNLNKTLWGMPVFGFDAWVPECVELHPSIEDWWKFCEDSVSFTGRHILYEERGELSDNETRILCDELREKIDAAMDIGGRITAVSYMSRIGGDYALQEAVEGNAAETLCLMRVNPLAVSDLLDDCGDMLGADTRQLARRLAVDEWQIISEREESSFTHGDEDVEDWWRDNTVLTRTGLQFPSLGAYRPATRMTSCMQNNVSTLVSTADTKNKSAPLVCDPADPLNQSESAVSGLVR